MKHSNQEIIDRFFEAYKKRDFEAIEKVMANNVTWFFMGRHPLAGIKIGIAEVIDFYDRMGKIMEQSNPKVEKLIVSEKDNYLIECIHSKTNNPDGNNLDHYACVLWTFKDGKIIEGRHFFANPPAVDNYFTAAARS
jgi:ketosteroid isomerase-like protein